MPMTTKERTGLREELTSQGYSWNYIDDWPPKITLYRHREIRNPSGDVVSPAGTALPNLPGQPDYVNRKARQGLLQWPPSDSCTCRWCGASKGAEKPEPSKAKRFKKVGPYHRDS